MFCLPKTAWPPTFGRFQRELPIFLCYRYLFLTITPFMSRHLLWGLCALSVALAACAPPKLISEYRIDVQQGNALNQEQVAQLRPGLSKDQVRFLLGTSLLTDTFHADRWDYVYRLRRGSASEVESRRLTVFFQDGKLTRVAGDVVPAQEG